MHSLSFSFSVYAHGFCTGDSSRNRAIKSSKYCFILKSSRNTQCPRCESICVPINTDSDIFSYCISEFGFIDPPDQSQMIDALRLVVYEYLTQAIFDHFFPKILVQPWGVGLERLRYAHWKKHGRGCPPPSPPHNILSLPFETRHFKVSPRSIFVTDVAIWSGKRRCRRCGQDCIRFIIRKHFHAGKNRTFGLVHERCVLTAVDSRAKVPNRQTEEGAREFARVAR
jgi:hypothetical protein